MTRVWNVTYKLKLTERLKLHLTFHVNFLKPYYTDPNLDKVKTKRNLPKVRVEFSKEIVSILKARQMGNLKSKWIEFLIHWKWTLISEAN